MALAEQITVGAILRRTFGGLLPNAVAVAIYVAGLSAIGIGIELSNDFEDIAVSLRTSSLQLLLALGGLFAQYLLLEHMLKTAGLIHVAGSKRFWAFIGQSILGFFGFIFGFLLFVVPGLILLARWSAAPGLLIGERKGAIEALGESWTLTRGHTGALVVSVVTLAFLFIAAAVAIFPFMVEGSMAGIVASEVAANFGTVVACSFAVAVFGLVHAPTHHLSEVFA